MRVRSRDGRSRVQLSSDTGRWDRATMSGCAEQWRISPGADRPASAWRSSPRSCCWLRSGSHRRRRRSGYRLRSQRRSPVRSRMIFGVVDGVVVAGAGAVTFAALGGWGAGEVAAMASGPQSSPGSACSAAGRPAPRWRSQFVKTQEEERRSLALTLHDDSARRSLAPCSRCARAVAPTSRSRSKPSGHAN